MFETDCRQIYGDVKTSPRQVICLIAAKTLKAIDPMAEPACGYETQETIMVTLHAACSFSPITNVLRPIGPYQYRIKSKIAAVGGCASWEALPDRISSWALESAGIRSDFPMLASRSGTGM